jgi:hypothetical protein
MTTPLKLKRITGFSSHQDLIDVTQMPRSEYFDKRTGKNITVTSDGYARADRRYKKENVREVDYGSMREFITSPIMNEITIEGVVDLDYRPPMIGALVSIEIPSKAAGGTIMGEGQVMRVDVGFEKFSDEASIMLRMSGTLKLAKEG